MWIVISIILIILIILLSKKKTYNITYTPKEKILTDTELKYYKVLKEIAKELNLDVIMQVSLYEILRANNYTSFNKISRKTIDFALIDSETKIKICIELDDKSHNQARRKSRDVFLNKIFKENNIPLLRQPVYKEYYKTTIEKNIKELIK